MPTIPLDIASVTGETGATASFSGDVDAPGLAVGPDEFSFGSPVAVDLTLLNGGDLIVLTGSASVTARADCVRCLEPFDLDLTADVEVYYVTDDEVETLPEDFDYEVYTGDTVDAWPAVLGALAEVAPFAPVHDESCRGICPVCGADLNVEECDCEPETAESPFAVLKGVFGESDPALESREAESVDGEAGQGPESTDEA